MRRLAGRSREALCSTFPSNVPSSVWYPEVCVEWLSLLADPALCCESFSQLQCAWPCEWLWEPGELSACDDAWEFCDSFRCTGKLDPAAIAAGPRGGFSGYLRTMGWSSCVSAASFEEAAAMKCGTETSFGRRGFLSVGKRKVALSKHWHATQVCMHQHKLVLLALLQALLGCTYLSS